MKPCSGQQLMNCPLRIKYFFGLEVRNNIHTRKSQAGWSQTGVLDQTKWTLFSSKLFWNINDGEYIFGSRKMIDLLNQVRGILKTLLLSQI